MSGDRAVTYAGPMPSNRPKNDVEKARARERIQAAREAARTADPEGYLAARRAETNDRRRKARVVALVDVVRYVQAALELGQTPEQVAEGLERRGVKPGKAEK